MIQLVFDADDAADALDERPVEVGYSSHEGAEKAAWDDDKLEIVGGTHPVVYPAAGSHANKFTDAAVPRQLGRGRGRLRRHAGTASRDHARGPHDPERSRGRRRCVPVDHVRGTMGRAAEGLLQRADRPQHEDAVADPDRMVGGLARSQLRRADRRPARHERHRLLLLRRRARLGCADLAASEPACGVHRPREPPRAVRLRRDQGDLDAGCRSSGRRAGARGARSSPRPPRCT